MLATLDGVQVFDHDVWVNLGVVPRLKTEATRNSHYRNFSPRPVTCFRNDVLTV